MKRPRDVDAKASVLRALKEGIAALSVSNLSSVQDLVCRDTHADAILHFLEEPSQLTMQVFGMPGTGKTATVHYALAQLSSSAMCGSTARAGKPTAVLLNGYVVQKSTDIYWTLHSHLTRARLASSESTNCAPEQCAADIERRFRHGWGGEVPALCVIVIDEVDKVLEKHPKALFKIIDWLSLPHAHCKLITISNSMELAVDAKTRSRLDSTRQLVFLPYGIQELKAIFLYRIRTITPRLFSDQAINLLCHQTAAQYGDVRRLLQAASAAICSTLMKINEGQTGGGLSLSSSSVGEVSGADLGIVGVKEVHGVVRQIFHDRFVEFVKTIQSPILYIVVSLLAKETERMYSRHAEDCRLPLDQLWLLTQSARHAHDTVTTVTPLSRAAFLELLDLLRQVSLIDVSYGEDRLPIHSPEALLTCAVDVFVALLQPFQTVVDACRLHDEFGSTIGAHLFA